MRVAHFQRDLPPERQGGVAKQVHLLANALSAGGISVTVFTLSEKPSDALYGVQPVAMPAWMRRRRLFRRFGLGLCFALTNTRGFDLIHVHGDNYLMFRQRPQVRTFYGSALKEAFSARRMGRFFSQLGFWILEMTGTLAADRSIGISPETGKFLPDFHGVVPCGVDPAVFKPGSEKSAAPSILFVGGLRDRKRGDRMLEIFASLRRAVPAAELWMVTSDPVAEEGVRSYSDLSDVALADLYRRAWLFCSLSSYEGFGLPLVEAMACGTPVVSTPNTGASFVLSDGRDGVLAPDHSVGQVLESLLKDGEARAQLTLLGLARARNFSVDAMVQGYLRHYRDLIPAAVFR